MLLSKVVPDMRSVELGGSADGEPIRTEVRDASSLGANEEAARRIKLLLHMAEESKQEEEPPTDGGPLGYTNGSNGAQRTPDGPESPTGPAVGEVTVIDKDRGITLRRLTADGRPDDGGDWLVVHGDKDLRVLRGITLPQAKAVLAAMDDGGKFDA